MGHSFINVLKTHAEKMSTFRLSMIFMKTNELERSFQDVYEKKGVRRWTRGREKWDVARVAYSYPSGPRPPWQGRPARARPWPGWPCHKGGGGHHGGDLGRLILTLERCLFPGGGGAFARTGAGRPRDSGRDAHTTSGGTASAVSRALVPTLA
jgi:hypothetical protein